MNKRLQSGIKVEELIREADERKLGFRTDGRCTECYPFGVGGELQPCIHELIEMNSNNWLKAYGRLVRGNHELVWIEELMANGGDMTTLIAACLRWVDLNPCEDCFEQAADMARNNTISELEQELYYIEERYEFVAMVLALVHYEVLSLLPKRKYIPRIEINIKGGKYFRNYVSR